MLMNKIGAYVIGQLKKSTHLSQIHQMARAASKKFKKFPFLPP